MRGLLSLNSSTIPASFFIMQFCIYSIMAEAPVLKPVFKFLIHSFLFSRINYSKRCSLSQELLFIPLQMHLVSSHRSISERFVVNMIVVGPTFLPLGKDTSLIP